MSTIHASNFGDGTNTVESGYVLNGSAKAYVWFNGVTGNTIENSMNVSSVTDGGAGTFAPNLTNALTDVYGIISAYTARSAIPKVTGSGGVMMSNTSAFRTYTTSAAASSLADAEFVASIMGDLA